MTTSPQKQIVIFGATSAIAAAVAEIYATSKAHLVLIGRTEAKLRRLQQHFIVKGASRVDIIQQDLNLQSHHASLIQGVLTLTPRPDVILLAHGILGNQTEASVNAQAMMEIMDTNALSQMSLLCHLTPVLETNRHGTVAVISSVAGDRGRQSNYVYGAAKATMTVFTDGLRGRLFRSGVHVVTIKPGFVATPMTAHLKQGPLFAKPATVARGIVKAIDCRRNIVYVPGFWRLIMLIIQHIPEVIFKKLPL